VANKVHVKTGDNVYVLSGKDKGKKGKVLHVDPQDMTVIVEGVNMSTKHKKPRGRYQQGGIIHQESPISSSKVMLICSRCKTPTKVGKVVREDGQKDRVCKKCGEIIDTQKEAKEE
jgi:large subunit ribosomal protein L24